MTLVSLQGISGYSLDRQRARQDRSRPGATTADCRGAQTAGLRRPALVENIGLRSSRGLDRALAASPRRAGSAGPARSARHHLQCIAAHRDRW